MQKDKRCEWCGTDNLYVEYHDKEWGKLTTDDTKMFEFLILEGAQAGLSWITVLRKREEYRKAFANFDVHKVAKFTEEDAEKILSNYNIVRNRLKVKSAIKNAQLFLVIQKEYGSFCKYLNSFMPENKTIINQWQSIKEVPASSKISDNISKDMKKRGFKFFGTTICYAFLQAVGYIDDHIVDCPSKSKKARIL